MHSAWFRRSFLRVLNFLQITEGGPNLWGQAILQKVWIIWSRLLYFNFKSFMDANFLSFIRFQCIFYNSVLLFPESSNFYKLKNGDLISGGNQFCRKSKLFGPPFCISILKLFVDSDLSSFIIFQCILHDSGVLFSESGNFYKLKKGHRISGRSQFWRKFKLFGPPFCIWISKVF